MLNRIKYILIAAIISASLIKPALAANDSTISYVEINNKVYSDIELMISDGAEILVPFKQLADLFEIKYSANRIDKIIEFTTYDGISGIINETGVYVNNQLIQKKRPIFLKQGIMDNVLNEAFINAKTAERIFGVELETDYSTITVSAKITRDIKALREAQSLEDEKAPKAYSDAVIPQKIGKITLNRVGVHSNFLNDNMRTQYRNYSSTSDYTYGNTSVRVSGDIYDGKYRIDSNLYHQEGNSFMFGGLSATYMNKFKDKKGDEYYYELGRVKGRSDVDAKIGTNIFGAQIFNYNYEKTPPNKLSGYVKPTSLVRVSINGEDPVTLSTYAGYYTLSEMQMPKNVQSIKVEEINEDGTVEIVKEEKYSLYGDRPLANEGRASAYAGVWGYQNRLFREGRNIYRGNNKKATAGGYYQYGLKDNVTFETKLTADKIYEKTSAELIYKVPTNDTLLVTGTQKNVNYLEGATTLNSIDYVSKKDPNLKLRGTVGGSIARDIRDDDTHVGYIVKGTGEYTKNLKNWAKGIFQPKTAKVKLDAYQTTPDFYIASTDATSRNDRIGGRASGAVSFNSTSVSGGYNKYYSNINKRYEGGTINFDEYNISATSRVPKVATLRYNLHHRRGSNDLGRNKNYYFEGNISRDISKYARVQGGIRKNVYDTRYYEPNSINRNYNSEFTDIYQQLDLPIPKNLGKFNLGHSFIDYNTSGYKNDYNMFRFGYTFPAWKRWTFGVGWGFRYHGQSGHDINATVGYRAKSGQMINVGYQYSENGGYFIDNMFMPTTNRHSVNLIFNDAYQFFSHGFKSIGDIEEDKGIFEAIAFIDTNNNGKYDKKIDLPMKDIPIITSWATEVEYTNRTGRISSASLPSGMYKVGLDMNSLPINVAPYANDLIMKNIKIEKGLTTKIELPLVSTVGSVSGVLKISDDFNRELKITDFIVSIIDDKGNEVNYSTVTSEGSFYISGLAPGKYTLKLDDRYMNAYGLEQIENMSERTIYIPYDYMNPIDVTNQNLEYKTLSL